MNGSIFKAIIHTTGTVFDFLIFSSAYLSIAGAAMAYISSVIQHIPYNFSMLAIMFLATFSVYNINRKTDETEDAINHSDRHLFTKRYEKLLSTGAILAYISAILLALSFGIAAALVSAIPLICGVLYSIPWIPEGYRYRRLKEIPFVKSLIVAFAWAITPALLPIYVGSRGADIVTFILLIFFFTLAFMNSVMFDMRDIEGDKASGIKTIPVLLGVHGTILFLTLLNLLSGALIIPSSYANLPPRLVYILIAAMAYANIYILSFNKDKMTSLLCDAAADGQFIIFGALIYIAK